MLHCLHWLSTNYYCLLVLGWARSSCGRIFLFTHSYSFAWTVTAKGSILDFIKNLHNFTTCFKGIFSNIDGSISQTCGTQVPFYDLLCLLSHPRPKLQQALGCRGICRTSKQVPLCSVGLTLKKVCIELQP